MKRTLREIVAETGYKDSPWFGAQRKKTRLAGEVVTLNCALTMCAVNQVFQGRDAKQIIDALLVSAQQQVFQILEAKDDAFKRLYEERIPDYIQALQEERPGIAVSFIFISSLGLDPFKSGSAQVRIAARFGESLSSLIKVVRSFQLEETEREAFAKMRQLASGHSAAPPPTKAPSSPTSAARQSPDGLGAWLAKTEPWRGLDPRLIGFLAKNLAGRPQAAGFVRVSEGCGLVWRFAALRTVLDQGRGETPVRQRIVRTLFESGQSSREALIRLLRDPVRDHEAVKKYYGQAVDAFESALALDMSAIACHLELALLRLVMGRKQDARTSCKVGIYLAETMQRLRSGVKTDGTGCDIEAVRERLQALWDGQLAQN